MFRYGLFADPKPAIDLHKVLEWLNHDTEGISPMKWHQLGIVLKVPASKLDEIEEDHRLVKRRLAEVINYWIKNGEVSWKVLWEALCDPSVAEKNLGKKIRDWYTEKCWRDPRQASDVHDGVVIPL